MSNVSKNRLWILGASDPEMAAIEQLLITADEVFVYATNRETKKRVHLGNAYQPHGMLDAVSELVQHYDHDDGEHLIFVECSSEVYGTSCRVDRIDHHNPGDPGYGMSAEKFWQASSYGQVFAMLNKQTICQNCNGGGIDENDICSGCQGCGHHALQPLPYELWIAAADHCLAAAYAGKCPGVNPEKLMQWRIEQRSSFQKRSVDAVMADVTDAMEALKARHTIDHEIKYVDMRNHPMPELPEAAVRLGVAYVAKVTEPSGRVKEVLGGHAPPEMVQEWIDNHSHKCSGCGSFDIDKQSWFCGQCGLSDIVSIETYGDPIRGFAGAYV